MIALDFNDPVFQRSTGTTAFFQRGRQFLECVFGQGHAGDGGHRLAATALAFAAHASNAVAGRDNGLFADAGVYRFTAFRAMTTCVGGKYQATKGGEGCGFFGHRQSSWEDKDWSRQPGQVPSTAKPHSGRGSATETVSFLVGADECNEAAIF